VGLLLKRYPGTSLIGNATQLTSGQISSDGFAALADLDANLATNTSTSQLTGTLSVSAASNDFFWRKQA
jgi:hypothetical protein